MTTIRFDDRTLSLALDDLPALTGSEKQIAWAQDIRVSLFHHQVGQRFDNVRAAPGTSAEFATKAVDVLNRTIAPLFDRQTSAKFWIDNRDRDIALLSKKA